MTDTIMDYYTVTYNMCLWHAHPNYSRVPEIEVSKLPPTVLLRYKMDLGEIQYGCVEWIHLVHDRANSRKYCN
jgi:hypothetical protein